jgi:hypothetical protein
MELWRLFEELTKAAKRCGIIVRIEPFDPGLSDEKRPRGGLCTLFGKPIILVDAKAPMPDRIAMVAAALGTLDLEHMFLPPIVRATIGAYKREAPAPPMPTMTEPQPLARAKWRDSEDD